MDKQKSAIIKACSLLLSFTLAVAAFSACGKNGNEEEITRGSEPIVAPSVSQTQYHGEVTTDPAATKNRSTTAAATTGAADSGETTGAAENITFANESENQAIQEAAAASGKSTQEVAEFVRTMGYDYDPKQGIFYTSYDNWQRQGNFVPLYDTAAHYINMNYKTVRIDFGPCDGYNWRMQLWKGEYGVFGGCEAGIYTADPEKNAQLYTAVDNNHMLQWESFLYLSESDFKNGNEWFYREWQSHWWLTGFKAGVVNPEDIVMYLHVRMLNPNMSNQFEEALLNSGYGKASVGIGPTKKQIEDNLKVDQFARSFNDFYIVWKNIGELNY